MKAEQQAVIEAVAKQFSATWEPGSDPSIAYLVVDGKRVTLEVASMVPRGTGEGRPKPRLRFDRVATRLLDSLRAGLANIVPAGTTVLLTVTAPIRVPGKTATALEERIRTILGHTTQLDAADDIYGNSVRIRVSSDASGRAPSVIGFVHNPGSDPILLLDIAREVLDLVSSEAAAGVTEPRSADDRWLAAVSAREHACLEAYRSAFAQLQSSSNFARVLILFGNEPLEALVD